MKIEINGAQIYGTPHEIAELLEILELRMKDKPSESESVTPDSRPHIVRETLDSLKDYRQNGQEPSPQTVPLLPYQPTPPWTYPNPNGPFWGDYVTADPLTPPYTITYSVSTGQSED